MPRTTLRRLSGLDDTPAKLADSTLVLVDYQNTYTTGVMELDGWQDALDAGAPGCWPAPGRKAPRSSTSSTTAARRQPVRPPGRDRADPPERRAGRGRARRHQEGTGLLLRHGPRRARRRGRKQRPRRRRLHDAHVRGVHRPGRLPARQRPTVVADACATRALPVADIEVDARQVHHSALATVADMYGVVVPSQESLG